MGFFCSFTCFVLAVYTYIKERRYYSPNFIFALLFGVSTFLSLLNYKDVTVNNNLTYKIIFIGVISFFVGGNIASFINKNKKKDIKIRKRNFNNYLYWTLVIICLITCLIWISDPMQILLSGGSVGDIYQQRLATEFSGSKGLMYYTGIKSQIIQYICRPLVTCLCIVSMCLFFDSFKKRYMFISVILVLIQSIATGGRTQGIVFMINLITCYSICKKGKINITQRRKRQINVVIIFAIIIIIYLFSTRGTQIKDTIISYLGFPIAHMEKRIETLVTGYTYGMSTFQGFIRPIINIIGLQDPPSLELATSMLGAIQKGTTLGQVQYNAFVTPFFFFYLDFRMFGVVIFSFLFGLFSNTLYYLAIKRKETGYIAMFLLSFGWPICFAMVRFQYVLQENVYALILIMLIFSKRKFIIKK